MEGILHKAGKQVSMKQFSVGSCINRKEISLIPTLRLENLANISSECLHPEKYLDEMLARFSDLQVSIRELSFPMYTVLCYHLCICCSAIPTSCYFFNIFSLVYCYILSPCRLHKLRPSFREKYALMTEQITRHRV